MTTDATERTLDYTDEVHMNALAAMQYLSDTLIEHVGWIEKPFNGLHEYADLILEAAIRVHQDGATKHLDTPFDGVEEHGTLLDAIGTVKSTIENAMGDMVDTECYPNAGDYRVLCCGQTGMLIEYVQSYVFSGSLPAIIDVPHDSQNLESVFLGVWAVLYTYSDNILAHQRRDQAPSMSQVSHGSCAERQVAEYHLIVAMHYVRGFQQAVHTTLEHYAEDIPTPWLAGLIVGALEEFLQSDDTLRETTRMVETMVKYS